PRSFAKCGECAQELLVARHCPETAARVRQAIRERVDGPSLEDERLHPLVVPLRDNLRDGRLARLAEQLRVALDDDELGAMVRMRRLPGARVIDSRLKGRTERTLTGGVERVDACNDLARVRR